MPNTNKSNRANKKKLKKLLGKFSTKAKSVICTYFSTMGKGKEINGPFIEEHAEEISLALANVGITIPPSVIIQFGKLVESVGLSQSEITNEMCGSGSEVNTESSGDKTATNSGERKSGENKSYGSIIASGLTVLGGIGYLWG